MEINTTLCKTLVRRCTKVKSQKKRKKNKLRKKTTWISALRTGKGFLNNEQIQNECKYFYIKYAIKLKGKEKRNKIFLTNIF